MMVMMMRDVLLLSYPVGTLRSTCSVDGVRLWHGNELDGERCTTPMDLRFPADPETNAPSSVAFGAASVALPAAFNLSHNAAFACAADGKTVLAYGGRRKFLRFRDIDLKVPYTPHGAALALREQPPQATL